MPAAAIPIAKGIGAAGSAAAGSSGKKASNAGSQLAQQELGLQQKQFGIAQNQLNQGNQALAPAGNYWKSLLGGGQAAVQAVGPYASQIGQAAEGARNSIQALTPRGGEQNLALAQNYNTAANNVSRLYAGMQPLAASQLQGLGGQYLGSAQGFNPGANIGAGAGIYGQQMQNAIGAGTGFGNLLYGAMRKGSPGSSTGGKSTGSTPPFVGGKT